MRTDQAGSRSQPASQSTGQAWGPKIYPRACSDWAESWKHKQKHRKSQHSSSTTPEMLVFHWVFWHFLSPNCRNDSFSFSILTFLTFGQTWTWPEGPGHTPGLAQIGLEAKNHEKPKEIKAFQEHQARNDNFSLSILTFLSLVCRNESFSLSILTFLTFGQIWTWLECPGPTPDLLSRAISQKC